MRALATLVVCALASSSCSLILDFNQCKIDSDCVGYTLDGGTAYCTSDHICVSDVPASRLCKVSPVGSQDSHDVTIAGLLRLTGANDVVDTALEDAIELAVSEINTAGDRQIRLVECDTNGDPDQARKALTVAVESFDAVAVVGPTSSGELIALAQEGANLVTQYGVLVVSPSATSPSVTSLSDQDLIWRTCASDALQAKELANLVNAMSPAPTAIGDAYVSSSYGIGLGTAFVSALSTLNPALPVPVAQAISSGTSGAAFAAALGTNSPQVALIVADSDAPVWVAGLDTPALANTQFLLTDGAFAPALFSMNPSTSILMRIQGTAPATPSGAVFNTFEASYFGKYGMSAASTAFVANSYDALYAIAIAMGVVPATEKVTGGRLIPGMQMLSSGLPMNVGIGDYAAAYTRLSEGGTVNLTGASGPIDFNPDTGDVLSAPFEVWSVNTSTMPPTFNTVQVVNP
jgi:branched-chain amino acid transport system substrate-binding protein